MLLYPAVSLLLSCYLTASLIVVLLLLYCCFTAAFLLLELLFYCCFPAVLLPLYCRFTAAVSCATTRGGAIFSEHTKKPQNHEGEGKKLASFTSVVMRFRSACALRLMPLSVRLVHLSTQKKTVARRAGCRESSMSSAAGVRLMPLSPNITATFRRDMHQ